MATHGIGCAFLCSLHPAEEILQVPAHLCRHSGRHEPAPISVKDGLLLTLPGIYAEYSAKQGGRVLKMKYPWDKDWSTEIEAF